MTLHITMDQYHLILMMLCLDEFSESVRKFKSSSPNVKDYGWNGYYEITVEFEIQDLIKFSSLFEKTKQALSNNEKNIRTNIYNINLKGLK